MTKTESQFRNWAKKEYPKGYIKKIPDFKQMGKLAVVGLPDYLVINQEETIWYEVKSGFGNTISLKNHLTDGQLIEFMKMYLAGADIKIYCFTKSKGRHIIDYDQLLNDGKIKFK